MMIEAGRRAAGILYAGTPTQPARFHASRSAPNAKSKAIGSRRGSIISVSRWRALRPWFRCASSGAPRPTSRKDRPTARRNPASGIPTATRSTFRSTDGRTESAKLPANVHSASATPRSSQQAIAIGLSKACAPWPALSSAGEEQCLRASQCSSHSMLARAGEHFGHAAAVQRRAEDKMQRAKSGPAAMFEPSVAASEHNKGPKP